MSEKYFSLESIKQDIEWLQNAGSQELLLREVLGRFEYGAIPAADVRPVVRGRWVKIYEDGEPTVIQHQIGVFCSKCKSMPKDKFTESFFCPNCGADMREENEEMKNEDN